MPTDANTKNMFERKLLRKSCTSSASKYSVHITINIGDDKRSQIASKKNCEAGKNATFLQNENGTKVRNVWSFDDLIVSLLFPSTFEFARQQHLVSRTERCLERHVIHVVNVRTIVTPGGKHHVSLDYNSRNNRHISNWKIARSDYKPNNFSFIHWVTISLVNTYLNPTYLNLITYSNKVMVELVFLRV